MTIQTDLEAAPLVLDVTAATRQEVTVPFASALRGFDLLLDPTSFLSGGTFTCTLSIQYSYDSGATWKVGPSATYTSAGLRAWTLLTRAGRPGRPLLGFTLPSRQPCQVKVVVTPTRSMSMQVRTVADIS